MKRLNLLLSLGAAALCVCATGCHKSETAANPSKPSAALADKPAAAAATTSASRSEPIQTEPAGPVEMKFKWQSGKQYDEEMNMSQSAHLEAQGLGKPVEQQMKMTESFTISALKSTPDGGTEMQLKFTRQKLNSSMAGKTVANFDSANPTQDTNNPMAAMFSKLMGVKLNYLIDANGKLVHIENMDAFLSQVSGGDPQGAAALKSLLSEENIKQMVSHGQEALPPKPVKVGDSWPVAMTINAGPLGDMKFDLHYTFKGWQQHEGHKCALMEFSGTITTAPKGADPMNLKIENGKIDGRVWYSPDLGVIVGTESAQTMDMKMSLQGKSVSSRMQQESSTRLVKVSDIK